MREPKVQTVQIVTREWLRDKINQNPTLVIGRALVALFRRQTEDEATYNFTKFHNGVGFSSNDARIGSIGAKYFIKHGTLTEGLMKGWLKLDKKGFPRIAKYVRQLNEIAMNKISIKENENSNNTPHGIP